MAKSDLFNDYYINLMPICSKTVCPTENLFYKNYKYMKNSIVAPSNVRNEYARF